MSNVGDEFSVLPVFISLALLRLHKSVVRISCHLFFSPPFPPVFVKKFFS